MTDKNKKLKFVPRQLGYIKPQCDDFRRATEIPNLTINQYIEHYDCTHSAECKNYCGKKCTEKIINF